MYSPAVHHWACLAYYSLSNSDSWLGQTLFGTSRIGSMWFGESLGAESRFGNSLFGISSLGGQMFGT